MGLKSNDDMANEAISLFRRACEETRRARRAESKATTALVDAQNRLARAKRDEQKAKDYMDRMLRQAEAC